MSVEFNRQAVMEGLVATRAQLADAHALGAGMGGEIDRIYFVACGSANRAMLGLTYWIEHFSPSLEVRRYFPAEFMVIDPPRLDARTLVILASKSGTTPETVAAAEFLKGKPCKVVALSQFADKALIRHCPQHFVVGETTESFTAMFMLMQALTGGLLQVGGVGPARDALLGALDALPGAICDAAEQNDARARADAEAYRNDRHFYHVAAGPCFTSAYVFGVCILMEMLWLHSYPIEAAEFFHGPFEIVDRQTPLILITGEDPSRPLMERVTRFCGKHAGRVMAYDSRDYEMKGVPPELRGMMAPYVLQAALKRLSVHLSVLHGQPLSTRRYMWKTEY